MSNKWYTALGYIQTQQQQHASCVTNDDNSDGIMNDVALFWNNNISAAERALFLMTNDIFSCS